MLNDLKAMAIFAEVVNKGSFREAAQSLSLSPSVVSYHISQLEQRLGAALLYRSTRRLTLSPDGEQFFEHVCLMLDAAKQGLNKISAVNDPSGKVRISLPTSLAISDINQRIADFAHQYQKVTLEIDFSDMRKNIIQEGIDLVIRAGESEDSNFKSKAVGQLSRVLVCAKSCFNAHPMPTDPEDLNAWPWIRLSQLPNTRTFSKQGIKKAISYNYQVSVNSVEAMHQYCLLGMGLATPAKSQVCQSIQNGNLVHVLPDWQVAPIKLYALWPKNVTQQSAVKKLLSFLCHPE